ncbi:MAG: diguanylate cyclase [Endomicrobiales bacterium]|nr:diguanylate cyclase [Endomicrobiales bacterium]
MIFQRIKPEIIAGFAVLVFLFAYKLVPDAVLRQVLIFFLVPVSLALGSSKPRITVFLNGIGVTLVLVNDSLMTWPAVTSGLILLLGGTAIIPFYYGQLMTAEKESCRNRNAALKKRSETLEKMVEEKKSERKELEGEIEKINHLYVLGKELVEHLELEDVLENLNRTLMNRPGVKSVTVAGWEKNRWRMLLCGNEENTALWLDYINQTKGLKWEKKYRIVSRAEWMNDASVVLWPVRIEKDLLAVVFLVVEDELALRYVEEGNIFVPQIALGLKRTLLFAEVQDRSRTDGLTGLYLRRYFLERLQSEIQRAKRYSSVFSIILADIDFFKKVNDTYGHLVGDKVLCAISRILVDCTRPGDIVGRYGGEEFIILLPMAGAEEAAAVASEMSRMVTKKEFTSGHSRFSVTLSFGVAQYQKDAADAHELLAGVDQALYWVKSHGRNGVKTFSWTNSE